MLRAKWPGESLRLTPSSALMMTSIQRAVVYNAENPSPPQEGFHRRIEYRSVDDRLRFGNDLDGRFSVQLIGCRRSLPPFDPVSSDLYRATLSRRDSTSSWDHSTATPSWPISTDAGLCEVMITTPYRTSLSLVLMWYVACPPFYEANGHLPDFGSQKLCRARPTALER